MEEKKYVTPEMEIDVFENEDIITTSNGSNETEWVG